MARLLLALIGIVLCALAPQVQAQSSTTPHQHANTSPVIDGAVHPELIPDSTAYRLYFVAVSTGPTPTDEDRKRQQAHLGKVGLQEQDLNMLISTLTEFRTKRDALVTQYNQAAQAAAARNEASDISSLLQQLDGLVQSIRDTLKVRLSPQGMTQFDAFVQSEKTHMKVHAEGQ
jgi:hypothetical protein